ncbi:hypothetical protein RJ639_028102, partial [Escallonia herrerae]
SLERGREMEFARKAKPHVVCIPYPAQSHIKAMLKLAKLLHNKGRHITFVNTQFNHKRFLKAGGPNSLDGLPDFRFETIPDGLHPSDADATQDITAFCESTRRSCYAPFLDLCAELDDPPVSSIVSDDFMTFTLDAAEVLGIPAILFWTLSACGFMGFCQFQALLERGLIPLNDESYLTNGYLDTVVDRILGMKDIRLKDFPGMWLKISSASYLLTLKTNVVCERVQERRKEMEFARKAKPHVVCIPYPAQSHIKAMLKLAKLLHNKGFHITFVNTEFNHKRFLKAGGPNSLDGLPDFRFETIPDGLPPSDDATQDNLALCESVRRTCYAPFLDLCAKLDDPPVSRIVSDGFMTFTLDAAEVLGIPIILFWTLSACGFMGLYQCQALFDRGLIPLKDESYLTNGYLDTVVDCIPGMKDIRLKDFPDFIRTTNQDDFFLNFCLEAAQRSYKASANIIQTFDALEPDLVNALSTTLPHVYTIGPVQLLLKKMSSEEEHLKFIRYSLWKEEHVCLEWLNSKGPNSVVYVNFGSITVVTHQQLVEFALGLANSNQHFLWIIRPDLVVGESAILPPEFVEVTKERGFIASWCPQEQVLDHPSIGGFLTHCGWNSTIESLSSGVPMICWPFFADQPTNCRFICKEWEVGIEIGDVNAEKVEKLARELIEGVEGKRMRNKAKEWKRRAEEATAPDGSSSLNLERLVKKLRSHRTSISS